MSVVEEIRSKLAKYPQARVDYDDSSITCYPVDLDGFVVRLTIQSGSGGERYSVYYNGSREAWSPLTGRWDADWDFVRWLRALAFWKRLTVRYLQNRLIDLDDENLKAA